MVSKKGQAGIEFLMTYGWVIVIAIVALAALVAFGVFNPPVQEIFTGSGGLGTIMAGVTSSPSEVYAKVNADPTITVDNSLQTQITLIVSSVTVKKKAGSISCSAPSASNVVIDAGSTGKMAITGCQPGTAGEPYEASINGNFTDGMYTYPFSFKFIKKVSL